MKAATIIFSPNGGISLIESFALVCMFAHTNLITYESLYSSSYLLNEYLLYDKLWGPSQRVVTLFSSGHLKVLSSIFDYSLSGSKKNEKLKMQLEDTF